MRPSSSTLRHRLPALLWCLVASAACIVAVLAQETPPNAYATALDTVASGDLELRRYFAERALNALISANRAEMTRAGGKARWRAGAARFVRQLEDTQARLGRVSSIDILRERPGAVVLVLDAERVMLSVPRLSTEAAFEAMLAETVCQHVACVETTPAGRASATGSPPSEVAGQAGITTEIGTAPDPGNDDVVSPALSDEDDPSVAMAWQFGDHALPVLAARDGLSCTFDDSRDLYLKARVCAAIMAELRGLAAGLTGIVARGGNLDWPALAIEQPPLAPVVHVIYARDGAYFRMRQGFLAQAPGLWQAALPWLAARVSGASGEAMIKIPKTLVHAPRA